MIGLAGKSNADAGGYLDVDARNYKGHSESIDDPRCDDFDLFLRVQLLTQDHEFVSRNPSDCVGWSKSTLEALTDSHQEVISDLMAERVVDRLEVVKIAEEDRHYLSGPATPNDCMVDSFQEQNAIG